jgi:lipopolysaccharide export LptBFGC system permease protein LptF
MVFVLHRYIFRELFKVFALATVALTLIMTLGSILRPIQEYGVGPTQVVHLLGYFIPITLTFVLPLSALFAAALVYGRFAGDNELNACRASGISLLTLIYPGLALAIIVATANLILSFYVVPEFFHRAERALKADTKQILFRNIQRKGFYEEPKREYQIYADEANPQTNTLLGVIVTRVEAGRIQRIVTTEQAHINFISHKNFNEVQIIAKELYEMGEQGNRWSYLGQFPANIPFPSLLGDDIKFKKIDQMKEIRRNPLNFYPIEQSARETCAQFQAELIAQDITECFNSDANGFYELRGEPNSVKINAARAAANTNIKDDASEHQEVSLTGRVVALEFDTESKQPCRTWYCSEALLRIEGDEFNPTLRLELYSPRWQNIDGAEGIAAGRKFIRGLLLPKGVTEKIVRADILDAITPQAVGAALKNGPSDKLKLLQKKLQMYIRNAVVEILAEIHTRLVFGISCIPLIIIGIGLGIILRGGHLLSAFGASAVPAGLLVVCIMMGKNVATNPGAGLTAGILLMWAGFSVLVLLASVILHRLLKN